MCVLTLNKGPLVSIQSYHPKQFSWPGLVAVFSSQKNPRIATPIICQSCLPFFSASQHNSDLQFFAVCASDSLSRLLFVADYGCMRVMVSVYSYNKTGAIAEGLFMWKSEREYVLDTVEPKVRTVGMMCSVTHRGTAPVAALGERRGILFAFALIPKTNINHLMRMIPQTPMKVACGDCWWKHILCRILST